MVLNADQGSRNVFDFVVSGWLSPGTRMIFMWSLIERTW